MKWAQLLITQLTVRTSHIFCPLQGDSGGPLHVIMDDGRYKQIGITSFGLVFGCELGLHAAFTRTSEYRQIGQ